MLMLLSSAVDSNNTKLCIPYYDQSTIEANMFNRRNAILGVIAVIVVGFIILQVVPGFARTNPPVQYKVNWSSPETENLMRTACYDCHTNETVWPWYSQIAPISWLVVHDVNEGREKLNFSDGTGEIEADELIRQIQDGEMPPKIYLTMHPDANLSATQKAALIDGIRATSFTGISSDGKGEGGERDEGG
jgi:hypothetical protein